MSFFYDLLALVFNQSPTNILHYFYFFQFNRSSFLTKKKVLESIVTRIKRLSQMPEVQTMPVSKLRIIAASATLPNLHDIAAWLSTPTRKCKQFAFGEEYR